MATPRDVRIMQNVRFSALGVILGSLFLVALVVITDVPKPMTFTLLALMVAGVGMMKRRTRRRGFRDRIRQRLASLHYAGA